MNYGTNADANNWLSALYAGDPNAFTLVVERYSKLLMKLVLSRDDPRKHPAIGAEDVVQNSWIALMKLIRKCNTITVPSEEQFRALLIVILKRQTISSQRKEMRRRKVTATFEVRLVQLTIDFTMDCALDPTSLAEPEAIVLDDISVVLAKIDDPVLTAIVALRRDRYTMRDIEKQLGVTRKTIISKLAVFRASISKSTD